MHDIKISETDNKNIFIAKNCFSKEDLKNESTFLQVIIGSLTAKYKDFSFSLESSDDLPNWVNVLLPLERFRIKFNSTPNVSYDVEKGDFLTFPSKTSFIISDQYSTNELTKQYKIYELTKQYKIYYYPKIKKQEGRNKYTIKATLQDNYNIDIYADSEEEALQKAYNIPLPEWNHEEIDDKPEKIKIIRWSRWGNFKII
jgi:hypothetical protein